MLLSIHELCFVSLQAAQKQAKNKKKVSYLSSHHFYLGGAGIDLNGSLGWNVSLMKGKHQFICDGSRRAMF